jgi:predicted small secreted protein
MKKVIALLLAVSVLVAGCATDADVASKNLSKAADQFEVLRRVVFYNGITGEYILSIEGLCSLGNNDTAGRLSVTCRTGPSEYKKHFLGLSDNVTFFAEQLQPNPADVYRYRVIFKPESIIPDIDLELRSGE